MSEGVGATVRRSIGSRHLRSLNPFLLLDYLETENPKASFPDHPHRGLETVTHVYEGTIEHEDFTGKRGTLNPGDLQVMTAGKGIMHAEIPQPSEDGGKSLGLQLWVDLPKHLKKIDPKYRDIRTESVISTEPYPGVKLRTVSNGTSNSITYTPMFYWDYFVVPSATPISVISPLIPRGWTSFLYVTQGSLQAVSGSEATSITEVPEHNLVVYDPDMESKSAAQVAIPQSTSPVRFTICAGMPLQQEIYRDMFFVQTTKDQLRQSKIDFKEKINGFEKAKDWKSKIAAAIDYKLHI